MDMSLLEAECESPGWVCGFERQCPLVESNRTEDGRTLTPGSAPGYHALDPPQLGSESVCNQLIAGACSVLVPVQCADRSSRVARGVQSWIR